MAPALKIRRATIITSRISLTSTLYELQEEWCSVITSQPQPLASTARPPKQQVHESLLGTQVKSMLALDPFSILGVLLLPQHRLVANQKIPQHLPAYPNNSFFSRIGRMETKWLISVVNDSSFCIWSEWQYCFSYRMRCFVFTLLRFPTQLAGTLYANKKRGQYSRKLPALSHRP